jgi:hypothetical protein
MAMVRVSDKTLFALISVRDSLEGEKRSLSQTIEYLIMLHGGVN